MLKNSKQSPNLPLQSYKIDNSHLQTKINELQQLKSQLKSTISRSKEDRASLLNQIHELKQENEILKNEINKLQFTKKSQNQLIQQLQKKLEQAQASLYDVQQQLKQEQSRRLEAQRESEQKLRQLYADKQKIVNLYEQELFRISKVTEVNNSGEIKRLLDKMPQDQQIPSSKSLPRQSIKVKRIKKASTQAVPVVTLNSASNQKFWTNSPQRQEQTAQDIYLEMIRNVYKQLCKIQIKSKDILNIPIIGSFSQLRSPTNNDIHRFFSNYPFSITDKEKINIIHEFIVKENERKGHYTTGKEIIRQIASSLEQIEGQKEMSFASGNSSATYLNESSLSVNLKNDGVRRISKPQVATALEYIGGLSKGTIEQQESMRSGDSLLQ